MSESFTEEELVWIREKFDLFDRDKSGAIDRHELRLLLHVVGVDLTLAETDDVLDKIDSSGDDLIQFEEFCTLFQHRRPSSKEQAFLDLVDAFKKIDRNQDGRISMKELSYVLQNVGPEALTDEEFEELVSLGDLDDDGKLNYEELARVLLDYQGEVPHRPPVEEEGRDADSAEPQDSDLLCENQDTERFDEGEGDESVLDTDRTDGMEDEGGILSPEAKDEDGDGRPDDDDIDTDRKTP